MQTWVYDFCNLYQPEGTEYRKDEFNIRIKPLKCAESFEEKRAKRGSKYQTGYWITAKVHITAERKRADELADYLSYIYSFAQNRDVTWNTRYPYADGYDGALFRSTGTFALDNSNTRLMKGIAGEKRMKDIGEFVDVALRTFEDASENQRNRLKRSLMAYLEAEGQEFWIFRFLFLWLVLESLANHNYREYLSQPNVDPVFSGHERNDIRESVVTHLESGDWSESQIGRIKHILSRDHIYEMSTEHRIKIYLEYLNIGFNIDEIREII